MWWVLVSEIVIFGGLLASYYTDNIVMSGLVLRIALPMIALLFLVVESRHVNLVEAVVERVSALEKRIVDSRQSAGQASAGWYDGPRVSEVCQDGANRWWPRRGMTFALNQLFYFIAYQWTSVTGGEDGMPGVPRPAFLGLDFKNPLMFYAFVSAFFLISLFLMKRIVESPLGKILQAIRENEVRAEAVGYNVRRFKLIARWGFSRICKGRKFALAS